MLLDETTDDFVCAIIRPATLFGYAPRKRLDLSVNILTNHGFNNGLIKVFGGSQLRPNLHIKDMVEAYRVLLEAEDTTIQGEVFNCGYQNMSIADIVVLVSEIVPKYRPELGGLSIETQPSNDLLSYHVNSDKITRVLGITPRHSVANAFEDLCQAFSQDLLPDFFHGHPIFQCTANEGIGRSMTQPIALVTGGAGFIGSQSVDAPLAKAFAVRVVDDLRGGRLANLEHAHPGPSFEFHAVNF